MAAGSATPPAIAMQRTSPFTDLHDHTTSLTSLHLVCRVCVGSFVCNFLSSLAPATTTPPPRGVEEPLRELPRGFRVPSQQPDTTALPPRSAEEPLRELPRGFWVPSQQPDTTTPPPRGVEEPLRELSQGSRDPSQQPDTTTPPPRGVEEALDHCTDLQHNTIQYNTTT